MDVRTDIGGPSERVETVIAGAGQAGLAAGYQLGRRGRPYRDQARRGRQGHARHRAYYALPQTPDAIRELATGHARGKLIVAI